MKSKLSLTMVLFMFLISSCQQNSNSGLTPTYTIKNTMASQQPVATHTPKLIAPTEIITLASSTPFTTPTLISTSTLTPIPIPTLDAAERSNAVMKLMESNGDCEFPCWWGIIPGKTSVMEIRRFFTYLGIGYSEIKQTQDSGLDSLFHPGVGGIDLLSLTTIRIRYIGLKDEQVERIFIEGQSLLNTEAERLAFKKLWSPISPENVITKYGIPDQILLTYNQAWPEYSLIFKYEKGIFLQYFGGFINSTLLICPSLNHWNPKMGDTIDVILSNPASHYNPLNDVNNPRELESVTNFTKTDFSKELISQRENFCFLVKPNP